LPERIRAFLRLAIAVIAMGVFGSTAMSHDDEPATGTHIEPVISAELRDADGKYATVVTVTMEPGASFVPHRHPGTVLVYVLEGEVESALDDEAAKVFKAGEAWTEYAGAIHRVTRNPATDNAKILAVLLHDKDAPLQLPAE